MFLVSGGMIGGSWGAPEVAVRLLRRDEMSGLAETGREEGGDVWVGIVSCGAVVWSGWAGVGLLIDLGRR